MTAVEMNIEFIRLLKAINKELVLSELPDTETIAQMLNISQIRYLKEIYFGNGEYERILSKADEVRDLIRRVTVNSTATSTAPYTYNSESIASIVDLSQVTDFMFYIRSDSKITRSAMPLVETASWMPNEFIKYSEKDKFLTTPVNIPIITKPGCYIENSGTNNILVIIHDIYTTITTTGGVNLEYIKLPRNIVISNDSNSVDSELPNFMHEDIVRFAVDTYINNYKLRLAPNNNNNNDRSRST